MNKTNALDCLTIEPNSHATASIIWLHGLGANASDFAPIAPTLQTLVNTPLRFIFPNAPIRPVTINQNMRMRAWYDIYSLEHLEQEDHDGIQQSQQEIKQLIQKEVGQGISHGRIVLAGFSQGGAVALYAGLSCPHALAGIIALSCYLPMPAILTETNNRAQTKTPVFQAHGEFDDVLPFTIGHTTYELLKENNHPVDWHPYPMGHHTCPQEISDIGSCLKKWLDIN